MRHRWILAALLAAAAIALVGAQPSSADPGHGQGNGEGHGGKLDHYCRRPTSATPKVGSGTTTSAYSGGFAPTLTRDLDSPEAPG